VERDDEPDCEHVLESCLGFDQATTLRMSIVFKAGFSHEGHHVVERTSHGIGSYGFRVRALMPRYLSRT
jgi:hypothetical protein